MQAAQAKGAELRIAAVAGVSTATVAAEERGGEEKEKGKGAGDSSDEGRERRISGVVLEDGEEIACDRVSILLQCWTNGEVDTYTSIRHLGKYAIELTVDWELETDGPLQYCYGWMGNGDAGRGLEA